MDELGDAKAFAVRGLGHFSRVQYWLDTWLKACAGAPCPRTPLPRGMFRSFLAVFTRTQTALTVSPPPSCRHSIDGPAASHALLCHCLPKTLTADSKDFAERLTLWIDLLHLLQAPQDLTIDQLDLALLTELVYFTAAVLDLGDSERALRLSREAHPYFHGGGA